VTATRAVEGDLGVSFSIRAVTEPASLGCRGQNQRSGGGLGKIVASDQPTGELQGREKGL